MFSFACNIKTQSTEKYDKAVFTLQPKPERKINHILLYFALGALFISHVHVIEYVHVFIYRGEQNLGSREEEGEKLCAAFFLSLHRCGVLWQVTDGDLITVFSIN